MYIIKMSSQLQDLMNSPPPYSFVDMNRGPPPMYDGTEQAYGPPPPYNCVFEYFDTMFEPEINNKTGEGNEFYSMCLMDGCLSEEELEILNEMREDIMMVDRE